MRVFWTIAVCLSLLLALAVESAEAKHRKRGKIFIPGIGVVTGGAIVRGRKANGQQRRDRAGAAPAGRWQPLAPVNGTGTTVCNRSGEAYACFALRCGKGRGTEFAFLYNRGDYGANPVAQLSTERGHAGTLQFSPVEAGREMVAAFDPGRHDGVLAALKAGRAMTFDIGFTHHFSLRGSSKEIERTLAMCAGETGGGALVAGGQRAGKVFAHSPNAIRATVSSLIANYRPTNEPYHYPDEKGEEAGRAFLAPPAFGDKSLSELQFIETRRKTYESKPIWQVGYGNPPPVMRTFIISPDHRNAIETEQNARKRGNGVLRLEDIRALRRQYEEIVADARLRYGDRHPAIGFVLKDLAQIIRLDRISSDDKSIETARDLLDVLDEAVVQLQSASMDDSYRSDVAEHLISVLMSTLEVLNDDGGKAGEIAPERNLPELFSTVAAIHRAAFGLQYDQLGWMLRAVNSSDDPVQRLDLLKARVYLARLLGDQQVLARTVNELASGYYLSNERELAKLTYREAFRVHYVSGTRSSDISNFMVSLDWRGKRFEPWRALKELGLEPELDYYIGARIDGFIREKAFSNNAGASWVSSFADVLEATGRTEIADQYYAYLAGSGAGRFDEGTAPLFIMSLFAEQRIDTEDYEAAVRFLERGVKIAEAVRDRQTTAVMLSQLARAHDEAGDLDKGLDYARRALRLVKAGGVETTQIGITALNTIITNSELEQGRKDKVAETLALELQARASAACKKGEKPYAMIAELLPVRLLLSDQVIAEEFLKHEAIGKYVDCFNAKRTQLPGITKPWADNLQPETISQVMLLLGMLDDRQAAAGILDFLFEENIWLARLNDRELLSLLPDRYLRHVTPSSRLPEARRIAWNERLNNYSAALAGLVTVGRGEWFQPYVPRLMGLLEELGVFAVRGASTSYGGAIESLGLDLYAIGEHEAAKQIHDAHKSALHAEWAREDIRRCRFLDDCEYLAVMDDAFNGSADADRYYEPIPSQFIVYNSGASADSSEVDALSELALKEGFLHERAGRFRLAEVYYGVAGFDYASMSRTNFKIDRFSDIQIAASMSHLRYGQGKLGDARAITEKMVAAVQEKLRGNSVYSTGALIRWSRRLGTIFETHLDSAAADAGGVIAGDESDFLAMQYLQTSKTAATIAQIAERASAGASGAVRRYQDILRQLSSRYSDLVTARGGNSSRLLAQIGELEQQAETARRDLEQTDAGFSHRLGFRFPSLADVQSRLVDGEALLLAYSGREHAYLWLVTRDANTLRRLGVSPDEAERMILALRAAVDGYLKTPLDQFETKEWAVAAFHAPYKAFLAPFAAMLGEVDRLYFVPNGVFDGLPLAVLLEEAPPKPAMTLAQMRQARLPWTIRSFAINVLPSVQSLEALSGLAPENDIGRAPFLGVANPDFGRGVRVAALSSRSVPDRIVQVPPLPDTQDEVTRIAALLGADPSVSLLLGKEASEERVRKADLSRYRVINFATHGILAGELPGVDEPALILSLPEKARGEFDGILKASEIATMKLDADLVLLSACNTAGSDGRPGAEGLSGLANAFFYAGVRNLVVTHWEIPSSPAVAVATGMIAAGTGPQEADWAGALRKSVLAMIDGDGPPEFVHPAAWGAHMVVGTETAQ